MRGCDLVGLSGGSPELVVIGEMKRSFTLELVLQAVDRMPACDEVWLAVGASKRGRGRESDARVKKLCRLLGFGLLTVGSAGRVDVVTEPTPWKPRRDAKRRSRIVEEHRRRKGDPVVGGSTRTPQMTAYRQRALVLANALSRRPSRPRDLRILAPDAAQILRGNVYGWFERIERGLYDVTSSGRVALLTWANQVFVGASAELVIDQVTTTNVTSKSSCPPGSFSRSQSKDVPDLSGRVATPTARSPSDSRLR